MAAVALSLAAFARAGASLDTVMATVAATAVDGGTATAMAMAAL
jgi:hypothetical protein